MHTTRESVAAGVVVSAQNIWSRELAAWSAAAVPLTLSRRAVTAQTRLERTARPPLKSAPMASTAQRQSASTRSRLSHPFQRKAGARYPVRRRT
jgi:hypothetical protein